MTDDPVSDPDKGVKSQRVQHRERRLKAALKANMAKRKTQVRGKAAMAADAATSESVADDVGETDDDAINGA